ncbi:MAG: hypothetical protein HY049_15495 [Acidobacteria bacterium]|nr:hypothetical protein [Acidobacteriota bacterium]
MTGTALALIALAALPSAGCAHHATTFVNPQADFSLIRRVAVLPLENLAQDQTAAEKIRQLLIIELLSSGSVEVLDVGEVGRALAAAKVVNAVSPGTEEVQRLGKELAVQGVVAGSVQEFSQVRTSGASNTSVSLVFRMIETDTGQVIWSTAISQSGVGASARLFGVGGASATERARDLIREALKTLIQ